MKKVFTTLALMVGALTFASAQKTVDLYIKAITPLTDQTLPNVPVGDSLLVAFEFGNNGPSAPAAGDTVLIVFNLNILGNPDISYTTTFTDFSSGTFAAGVKDTIGWYFTQGELLGTTSSGVDVYVKIPKDGVVDTSFAYIYGYEPGLLFTDAGITSTGEFETGSNNLDMQYNITFGTPSGIFNPNADKPTIAVYPNPTNNNINFNYSFDKSTTASARVFDLIGRTVITNDFGTQNVGNNKFSLNVSALPAGLYTLEFTVGDQVFVSKFNVNK